MDMDKGELQYQNQSASSASATFKRMAVWRETGGEDTIVKQNKEENKKKRRRARTRMRSCVHAHDCRRS